MEARREEFESLVAENRAKCDMDQFARVFPNDLGAQGLQGRFIEQKFQES